MAMNKLYTLLTGLMFAAFVAEAKLIAYEPFDYDDGNGETLEGSNTGFGWGGEFPAWTLTAPTTDTTASPSLKRHNAYTNGVVQYDFSYTDANGLSVSTHGNVYARFTDANRTGSNWENIVAKRTFAETNVLATGESIWMSILAMQHDTYQDANQVFFYLMTPNRNNDTWSITGAQHGSTLRWGIRTTNALKGHTNAPHPVNVAIPMFIIVQVQMTGATTATVRAWINPPDMSTAAALGAPSMSKTGLTSVTPQFYGFVVNTHKRRALSFDELRIGTTLRSVINGEIPPLATLLFSR